MPPTVYPQRQMLSSGPLVLRVGRRKKKGYPYRKRYAKKKGSYLPSKMRKIPFNIPMSQMKQFSTDSSSAGVTLTPSGTSYSSWDLTNIAQGQSYKDRLTNNIRVKRIRLQLALLNNSAVSRYVRCCIVGLRGSQNAADTVNWGDLLLDPSAYTKGQPNGAAFNAFTQINKDEYTVIYDRKIFVPGTGDSRPNVAAKLISLPMNRLVQYVESNTDVRHGKFWFVCFACEEVGTVPSASTVVFDYVSTTYFRDVRS